MADQQLCVCKEPTCTGCPCGADCAFLPGHQEGTKSSDPLQAMIEAAETLLENLSEAELDTDDHEQEETYGQLWSDVRRLYATIAAAKHSQGKSS